MLGAERSRLMAKTLKRTIPDPVVDWKVVVRAADPLRDPTRARYRRLLSGGIASKGVSAPVKGTTRGLGGRRTFHSVLAALAVRADRAGDPDGAKLLSDAASLLEERFGARIADFLLHSAPENLPRADFFHDLVLDTDVALKSWGRLDTVLFGSGPVTDTSRSDAHVWLTKPDGESTDMLIPLALTDAQGIGQGSEVWVFRTIVASASVVDVLPAIDVNDPSGEQTMLDTELDDKTYEAKLAADYSAGSGAVPSLDERNRLIANAQSRGVHRVSLVG
jgi:hypothetical protein